MLRPTLTVLSLGFILAGCDKPKEETTPPSGEGSAEQASGEEKSDAEQAEADKEAAKKAEEEAHKNRDFFTVATWNVAWAHDSLGSDGPKAAKENQAKTEEDWQWKAAAISKVIAEHKPDIIVLHELGGGDEAHDIEIEISKAGGPEYHYMHEPSVDDRNGHHSAIFSRFEISNSRRFDIYMKRHMVADVELPNGDTITVVAIHPPEGTRGNAKKGRLKQVDALERKLNKIRGERPMVIAASMGSEVATSDDEYKKSAAGMLAGANTGKEDDDCEDSAGVGSIVATTTDDKLADRIFSCGLTMRDGNAVGKDLIVRGFADKWDVPWSTVPVDKEPNRDVSDHLMVLVEIELPKPPPKEEKKEGGGEEAEE